MTWTVRCLYDLFHGCNYSHRNKQVVSSPFHPGGRGEQGWRESGTVSRTRHPEKKLWNIKTKENDMLPFSQKASTVAVEKTHHKSTKLRTRLNFGRPPTTFVSFPHKSTQLSLNFLLGLLISNGKLSPSPALLILRQQAAGREELHEMVVVHLLVPDNRGRLMGSVHSVPGRRMI